MRCSKIAIRFSLVLTLDPLFRLFVKVALKAVGGFLAQPGEVQVVTIVAQTWRVNGTMKFVEDRTSLGISPSDLKTF